MGMNCIGCPAWHGFYPFGDVIHGDKDVLAIMGPWEGSHIIDALNIEKFHLKIVG